MSTTDQLGSGPPISDEIWASTQNSADFTALRRKLRRFVFPVSAFFLVWYLIYVLLADYAHGFMSTKLTGNITVGLLLGLLQFVSTFVITGLYVWFANREIDPVADKIRQGVEASADGTPVDSAEETSVEASVEASTEGSEQ